ncbi:MAG: DHH family phosphoesterase [Gammaproteobacteria bacterium]|nr:DHH family phosphoesterase [Gammaproteobacteria bacterium]
MNNYFVFNGDADGICALQQLQLETPQIEARLITGVKRDISLLKRVNANAGDSITVLDISLDKNRDDANRLLDVGCKLRYFDHHYAGEIPEHENFSAFIDTAKDTCTSLIVDKYLEGRHRLWAITGAFGDNFAESATVLAKSSGLSEKQTTLLKTLGEAINYNGYGATLDDLHITPEDLALSIRPYTSPFEFIENEDSFRILEMGYENDIAMVKSLKPELETETRAIYILPCEAWARRVSGVYANDLANKSPQRAHAILTAKEDGNFLVSVRAPLSTRTGADELCRQFPSGGGRQAAAGINDLAVSAFDEFKQAFLNTPFA